MGSLENRLTSSAVLETEQLDDTNDGFPSEEIHKLFAIERIVNDQYLKCSYFWNVL